MGVVRLWLRADLRRRWRVQVVLALVIGIVGAVILTVAAGARETSSAYNRFLSRQIIADDQFDSLQADARAGVAALPGVRAAGTYAPMFVAPARQDLTPGSDFLMFAAADDKYGRTIDRPIVLQGRLPHPEAVDEVVVNEAGAKLAKLAVGTQTPLKTLAADEGDALTSGHVDQLTFHGPTPTVHVVGVVRTWLDLGQVSFANNYFLASAAFYKTYGEQIFGYPPQLAVLLQRPSEATPFIETAHNLVARRFPDSAEQFSGRDTKATLTSIRDAARVQALSLAIVGLAAAIAGLLGLALMTARTVTAMSPDFLPLEAMGLTRPGRAGLMGVTLVPGVAAGALLALVGATLASPLFPTAIARRTGPPPGIRFDALTLLPGVAVLVAAVLGAAAWTAYRWRPVPLVQAGLTVGPLDRFASVLPPSPRVGVRWALPRRDAIAGRGRAAIAGAVIAVCALVAALTYAAGLDHLVTTPSAYGWTFDADAGGGNDAGAALQMQDTFLHNRDIGDVGLARIAGSSHIDKAVSDVYGFEAVRGPFGPAVLTGRQPIAPDEILLGTKLARELHKKIGSKVTLVLGPGAPPATLRVVGLGVLPNIESDRFANSAAMTRTGLERIPGDDQDLRNFFDENTHLDVLFRLAPGVNKKRVLSGLYRQKLVSYVAAPPADVRNLDLVRSYPVWLAGFLAAIGLLTVVNALVVSARRRSQQVGVLRALGLTRSQIVGAVSAQGAAMALVGALVGIPVGIALGRWTWAASAHQLGVSQAFGAPLAVLFAVVGFGLVLLLILGATAGWWAGRATPATTLRTP